MNRDPILFRVDGTSHTGWERLARCMIYAAALQRRRRPTYFLSQLEPAHLGLTIKRGGSSWLEADGLAGTEEDLEETLQEIRRLRPAAVVVDAPDASVEYLTDLADTGTCVVSMDTAAETCFPSNLVINPLLRPGRDAYEFRPGTQLLLGRRYALVRPEFRRARPLRAQEPPPPFRALVALGDDDPNQQAGELVRMLAATPRVDRVDLIVRPQHPDLARLREIAEGSNRIDVCTEPAEITARLGRCHFAVSAGCAWALELACVGVPQLIILQSEAHRLNAQRLEDEGAAVLLGSHAKVTAQTLRQAVHNLLNDPHERQTMSRCGRKLIDARGPDRLVTALEILLHRTPLADLSEAA